MYQNATLPKRPIITGRSIGGAEFYLHGTDLFIVCTRLLRIALAGGWLDMHVMDFLVAQLPPCSTS